MKISLRSILLALCILAGLGCYANHARTLLIINSYTENSPWSREMINPIANHIATIDNVHCEIVHMNNMLITDSATYDNARSHILHRYESKKPDYVVFIGYLAFTLRDKVQECWGDNVPMLFITRTGTYRNLTDSYVGYQYGEPKEFPLTDLRGKYNLTVIEDLDHYKETIDLMDKLIERMDTLVFVSDAMPLNRSLNAKIQNYLKTNYPTKKYLWLKTIDKDERSLTGYFTNKSDHTGLLFGSWNTVAEDVNGNRMSTMGEILNMYSSTNPVFALRSPYIDFGAVGGVFSNQDNVRKNIISTIDAMLAGMSMRDIPFMYDNDVITPILNYELLLNYGLDPARCPDGTIFLHRPASFWELHLWKVIAVALILTLVIVLLVGRSRSQASKIKTLRRHQDFVEHMPVPFTKADILFDEKGNVKDIEYTLKNESFAKLIELNSRPEHPTKIFPYEFIAEQTTKLISTGKPVKFTYKFEKSGRSYDFLLCNVALRAMKRKGSANIKEVDLFANDITDRIKLEDDLKEMTSRFDITITQSGILPWMWYIKEDVVVFDAYSLFNRYNRDMNNPTAAFQSKISVHEYLSLLPEEDRYKLINTRRGLLDGTIKEFKERYRIKIARDGKDYYEWAEASGIVTKYDPADNKPLLMVGSIMIFTQYLSQAPNA